ncbi:MAG: hypothetical protein ACOZBH_02845 [Patescibacteria group bacterium]
MDAPLPLKILAAALLISLFIGFMLLSIKEQRKKDAQAVEQSSDAGRADVVSQGPADNPIDYGMTYPRPTEENIKAAEARARRVAAAIEYTRQHGGEVPRGVNDNDYSPLAAYPIPPDVSSMDPEVSYGTNLAGKVIHGPREFDGSLLGLRYLVVQRLDNQEKVAVLCDDSYKVPYNNLLEFQVIFISNRQATIYIVINDDPSLPTEALAGPGQILRPPPPDIQYPTEAMPDVVQPKDVQSAE